MTMPIELDPLRAALSDPSETQHITGDNQGGWLNNELLRQEIHAIEAVVGSMSSSSIDTPTTTTLGGHRTLADVPFMVLHLEVDDITGYAIQDAGYSARDWRGRNGLLGEYFTNHTRTPAWRHESHAASFQEDFPFSVDNFDCHKIAADLEDDYGMSNKKSVRHWAMWAGEMERTVGVTDGEVKELFSMRINGVSDMHDFLDCIRRGLRASNPAAAETAEAAAVGQAQAQAPRERAVFFLVAISYGRLLEDMRSHTHGFESSLTLSYQPPPSVSSGRSYALSFTERRQGAEGDDDDEHHNGSDGRSGRTGCKCGRCTGNAWYLVDKESPKWPFLQSSDSEPSESNISPYPLSEMSELPRPAVVEGEATPEDEFPAEEESQTTAPASILETLDTNAARGDAMEGDLHALIPEAQSPTEAEWQRCCSLLCLDANDHKDARIRSIKVPGTDNMWVKPSQLWTAYWMLSSRTERDLAGGVLADVMGTGKTYICLLVCLLRAFIGYNRAEVEREWQMREHEDKKAASSTAAPKQHLARSATGDDNSSEACPCGNALGIECYANPGGVTRRLADDLSRGASLVLVPPTVLDNWVKTIKHIRLQHKYFEPVVFHGKMAKEDTAMAPAPRLRQKLQMDVRPARGKGADGHFPASWEPTVTDVAYSFTPSTAKDAYPERFILLASHLPDRLIDFFQIAVPARRKAGSRERKTVYGCPIGIQFVDEFHKAREGAVALGRQHKHMQGGSSGGNFDFWAITGTPLPARLTDLETVTDMVQQLPEWDNADHRHHGGRVVDLQALQAAYESAVAETGTTEQAAEVRVRATRFFSGGLVMRHTEASTFFGRRIFQLQNVTARVVVHKTPAALRADVGQVAARVAAGVRETMATARAGAEESTANWAQVVRSSSLFNQLMNLEILATFPGAASLMLADPPAMDFGLAAIRTELRKTETRDPTSVALFQKHLDTIIAGSPHLETILATLDEMDADTQRRRVPKSEARGRGRGTAADDKTTTGTGSSEPGSGSGSGSALPPKKQDLGAKKLVVLCPRMGEAVFVYMALRKLRPDTPTVFLHADMRMAERTALLQSFNRLDCHTTTQKLLAGVPRVLVGTFRDAGTGNDLTVASYQLLTGPLRLHSQQDQAFGRTNREGQTLQLRHRLLVCEDSPVDRIVMATQAGRRIVSDPFDLEEELVLEAEVSET